jgi:hypothetical protein
LPDGRRFVKGASHFATSLTASAGGALLDGSFKAERNRSGGLVTRRTERQTTPSIHMSARALLIAKTTAIDMPSAATVLGNRATRREAVGRMDV